nr:DUF5688 family protein [uncultured Acetatifactor sp.]
MEMEAFVRKACKAVGERLGSGFRVEARDVRKNNGVILHGMSVIKKGQNVAPTIYLDTFLEAYESGAAFGTIMQRLLQICEESASGEDMDMGFFRSFEKVRDRICYRLVGRDRNRELLEDMPHVGFLDMAVCFFYAYQDEAFGEGSIPVHNPHMEAWETDTAELFALARRNTRRLFPWECRTLEEVLDELDGPSVQEDGWIGLPLRVLSNDRRAYGAACLLYPGVLEGIAEKEGCSFYILPSSVHEVILLPDDGEIVPDELKKMVAEVNRSYVAAEEVLTDSIYYFNMQKKEVVVA